MANEPALLLSALDIWISDLLGWFTGLIPSEIPHQVTLGLVWDTETSTNKLTPILLMVANGKLPPIGVKFVGEDLLRQPTELAAQICEMVRPMLEPAEEPE